MLTTVLEIIGATLVIAALAGIALAAVPAPWGWPAAGVVAGVGFVGLSAFIEKRRTR